MDHAGSCAVLSEQLLHAKEQNLEFMNPLKFT